MTDLDAMTLSCCYLIYACERVRDVERAAQGCDHLRHLAARWGYHAMFSFCRTHYAGVLIARGDWPRAEAELVAAVEELAATHPAMAVEGIVRLADLRRRQGRLDDAATLLARLDDHPLRMLGTTPGLLGRAAVALDRGDPATAAALVDAPCAPFRPRTGWGESRRWRRSSVVGPRSAIMLAPRRRCVSWRH